LYVVLRFGLAAALLALWPRARRGVSRGVWRGGAILGALLAVGFLFQTLGLERVTPAVSAFLTSLYVAFAAILSAWMHRARPHWPLLVGVALATLGAGFIEGPPQLTFGTAEWLTVACAFIFAFHILATDRITKAEEPMPVTLAMFACTAASGSLALASRAARAARLPLPSSPASCAIPDSCAALCCRLCSRRCSRCP
jgi:drug/metabolite transporter (DMT)-like permease